MSDFERPDPSIPTVDQRLAQLEAMIAAHQAAPPPAPPQFVVVHVPTPPAPPVIVPPALPTASVNFPPPTSHKPPGPPGLGGPHSTLIERDLEEILAILRRPKATTIKLELPTIRRKGHIMPNFELSNDTVATISIKTTNSQGTVEPVPAGDVFTATSSNPASLGAAIGTDAAGGPALVLTPLVVASPGLTVTVSDSTGLAQAVQIVDVVEDVTPTNVVLDLGNVKTAPQAVPTAPGP